MQTKKKTKPLNLTKLQIDKSSPSFDKAHI